MIDALVEYKQEKQRKALDNRLKDKIGLSDDELKSIKDKEKELNLAPDLSQNYNKENTIWLFDGVEWLTTSGAYHKYNLPTRSYIHNKIDNGWDINTIIYSILHQDLGLHKENGHIVTFDGFSVLVPNYIKRGEKYDIRKSKRISKKYT
jgi:hypothetical protein